MRVSFDELRNAIKLALQGQGWHAGLAQRAGQSWSWSLWHGLIACDQLQIFLGDSEQRQPPQPPKLISEKVLAGCDFTESSAWAYGQDIIDLRPQTNQWAITLNAVDSSLALLQALVTADIGAQTIQIEGIHFKITVLGRSFYMDDLAAAQIPQAQIQMRGSAVVKTIAPQNSQQELKAGFTLDQAEDIANQNLLNGFSIPEKLWGSLLDMGSKTLVPASMQSRLGACI